MIRYSIGAIALAGCVDATEPATSITEGEATVCGSGPTVKGVDVSYYQGTIDWPAAKADGVEFAFTRVSDGLTFEDPKFETNWSAIKANGMLRGAYQFFRPNQDPIAQADLLLQKIGTLGPGDLPPVIDVEVDGGLGPSAVASAVRKWVDHVTAAIGRPPIIYTGFYFWRDQVGAPDLTTSPLWHAQYTTADCPNIAPPWTDWAFWQFTSSGRVAGIDGNVDTNRFNGTREQLEQLAGAQRPCGTIDAAGGTIDDGDDCFTAGGPSQYLRHISAVGEGDDLIWTHATEDAAESNYAQWNLVMAEAGRYRIEVSTPAAYAQSTQARYVVHAAGEDHEFVVDQTAADGFQVLGELDLAQGGEQFIHLGDNTGEPLANNVQLVFDAVRLTRIGPGEGSGSGDGDGDGDDDGSSSGCSAGGAGGLPLALLALGLVVRRRRR